MNKKLILIFGSVFIMISAALLLTRGDSSVNRVCLKDGFCFRTEVVQTPGERAKGLMFRESLGQDRGMLFIFPEENAHAFWMKNTLIPLDIIWINSAKEVVFMAEGVQPCLDDNCETITPDSGTRYVLEVNAGAAAERGIKIGDRLDF